MLSHYLGKRKRDMTVSLLEAIKYSLSPLLLYFSGKRFLFIGLVCSPAALVVKVNNI
jgi:hypothetical protein